MANGKRERLKMTSEGVFAKDLEKSKAENFQARWDAVKLELNQLGKDIASLKESSEARVLAHTMAVELRMSSEKYLDICEVMEMNQNVGKEDEREI